MQQTEAFARRRNKLFDKMPVNSIAVIRNSDSKTRNADVSYPFRSCSDFYYITGLTEPESVAVFTKTETVQEYLLFVPPPFDALRAQFEGKRVDVAQAIATFGADNAFETDDFSYMLTDLLKGKTQLFIALGRDPELEQDILSVLHHFRLRGRTGDTTPQSIVNLDTILHEMRLRKSHEEIECLRKSAQVAGLAHQRVMQACQPGKMEYMLEGEFLHEIHQHGCRFLAYESIIASGANACTLHYGRNDGILHDGELLLVDAGAEYQHYASDITRTYPINGKFTGIQKELYEVVLRAQLAVIDSVKPGLSWDVMHKTAVREICSGLIAIGLLNGDRDTLIEQKHYTDFYMHSTGHWLGLDVHDVGLCKVDGKWRELEANMVFTVEPGIYIAPDNLNVDAAYRGIGIRIEDDVLVTAEGCEVLSKAVPKSITDIESIMK